MAYTTIDNPELYFQTKLYTGTGNSLAITLDGDEDMQPDLVWLKRRDGSTYSHRWNDSVRGVSKTIYSDLTNAENTSDAQVVTSFNSDGFTLGTSAGSNASGVNNVAWCWKASGSTASNTNGTNITSTVDANTTSGFSIVSWTGDGNASSTVGHGLGSGGIDMLITKNRDNGSSNWYTKHKDLSSDNNLLLDSTTAQFSNSGSTYGGLDNLSASAVFGFDAGSSSVRANLNTEKQIAYCFTDVQGFSKVSGSFIGNGSLDGAFCFTGFRPAFIMLKCSSHASSNWVILDNKRSNPFNDATCPDALYANDTASEATASPWVDLVSNGFKCRGYNEGNTINASGNTYIYIAFAEAPFVNSKGVPCNAR